MEGKRLRGRYRGMETEEEKQSGGIKAEKRGETDSRQSERKIGEIEGRDRWREKGRETEGSMRGEI
jgi:hypothetical protein